MRWGIIWTLTKKELKGYFDSTLAYIFVIITLGFCGFFTWMYGADVFFMGEVSLNTFFGFTAYWSFMFLIPLMSMRTVAEENKVGTIEFILTKPVNEIEFILGKFLGVVLTVAIAMSPTIIYVITLAYLGKPDMGAIWCGYLAVLLLAGLYASIGIFASSTTNNQIFAFLLSLFIIIFLQIIFPLLGRNLTGLVGEVITYLGVETHYDSMTRGVIDTRDVVYFLSGTIIFLLMGEYAILRRNMK